MSDMLVPWRCANPACPSRRTGPGQIVMHGPETPGWVGMAYCHQCRSFTVVRVTEDGVDYRVRRELPKSADAARARTRVDLG